MKISVIIPTLNESATLPILLPRLVGNADEILIADGGSTDATLQVARNFPLQIVQSHPGRAAQMNAGAAQVTGDLFWFLHADSIPPENWKEEILAVLSDPKVVGGGFRVAINAKGVGYRFLDAWGYLRSSFQGTFYGDQGIFIRRDVFQKLGGFFESAVAEDLDFSIRMKRIGKTALLDRSLKTSARRWEKHGWWPTVFQHSRLALTNQSVAVVIMAKDPVPGTVKTRLVPPLTEEEAANLARQLLRETAALAQGIRGAHAMVTVTPRSGMAHVRGLLPGALHFMAQEDGDFGYRLSRVFEELFQMGLQGVIALGADHPNLPRRYVKHAVSLLRSSRDRVVLGPTEDGGYYLIGMSRFHPELFEEIPWSTFEVLAATRLKAQALGLPVTLLPPWYDIDRPEDLGRLPIPPHLYPLPLKGERGG